MLDSKKTPERCRARHDVLPFPIIPSSHRIHTSLLAMKNKQKELMYIQLPVTRLVERAAQTLLHPPSTSPLCLHCTLMNCTTNCYRAL